MKKFTLFLSALLISMVSMAASYVKVTAAPADWSGEYLLVYEGETTTHVWTGVDAANGNVEATATDGTISGTDFVTITVTPMEGGYSIKVNGGANDGKYISGKSGDNKLNFGANAALNTLAYEDGSVKIVSNTSVMRFNSAKDNMRFRYFKSSSYTGQKVVQLYKNTDGTSPEEPENPDTPDTPEEPETPTEPEQPEGVITCAEAVAICQETGENATSEQYTIRGYVTEIKTAYSSQHGNISFWMADTKDGGKVLQTYRVEPTKAGEENVKVGDYVEVVGNLVNYYGNTPEVAQGGTYTILEAAEGGEDPVDPDQPGDDDDDEEDKPTTSGDVFVLVTDVADLQIGNQVVIAASESDLALSTTQNKNNRGQVAITKKGNTIIINDDVQVLTLEEGNIDGKFAFYTGEGYLYAASSSSNHLKTQEELSDNSSWQITITDGVASVVAQGESTHNVMQYNQSSSLFSCYASASQKPIAIYILDETTPTAIDNVTVNQNITKFFENGQLVIIKNGVKFNAQGQVIE